MHMGVHRNFFSFVGECKVLYCWHGANEGAENENITAKNFNVLIYFIILSVILVCLYENKKCGKIIAIHC